MNWQEKYTNGQSKSLEKAKRIFDIGNVSPFKYFVLVACGLGLLIALVTREQASPYGLAIHLIQWQIQSFLAILLLLITHIVIFQWIHFFKGKPWVQLIFSGFLGGLLFSLPAMAIDIIFKVDPVPPSWSSFLFSWLDELNGVLFPVCFTWVAINAPWVLGLRLSYRDKDSQVKIREIPNNKNIEIRPSFAKLVKNHNWGNIFYLKAELQYLKVVTDKGQDLILYNLRDAISELPKETGIKIHRSYWVAFSVIKLFRTKGRQGEIILNNGTKVPVSRSNIGRVKSLCENLGIKVE
jgi:hypothetical protein